MFTLYTNPENDPGEEHVVGTDPSNGEEWTAFVRCYPDVFMKKLRNDVGMTGKKDFADLPRDKQEEFSMKLASFVLVDVGDKFNVVPGDSESVKMLEKLLGEEGLEVGQPVYLRGKINREGVKKLIFTAGHMGPRIRSKVVEIATEMAKQGIKYKEELEKNS